MYFQRFKHWINLIEKKLRAFLKLSKFDGVSFPFFSFLIPINYESKHQSSISIAKNDIMPKKDLLLDEILKIKSSLKHVKRRVKKRSYSPLFSF